MSTANIMSTATTATAEIDVERPLTSSDWRDEHLLALPDVPGKIELVDGRLEMMAPAGGEHGRQSVLLSAALLVYVHAHNLGDVFDGQTGFRLNNKNLRSPDISFVSAARLMAMKGVPEGFIHGAPDLAVEIMSPGDSKNKIEQRLADLFLSGLKLAWVIKPSKRTVIVYRDNRVVRELTAGDTLDGEDVVPGFSLPLAELFAPPPWAR